MAEKEDYTKDVGPAGETGPTGGTGPEGPPGTTTWAGITDKPSTFAPSSHHQSHEAPDGDDQLGPAYFIRNKQTIDRDYTFGPGYNGSVVGPITVADTKTLTISDNCRLVVL